jgi:hypothetical protein
MSRPEAYEVFAVRYATKQDRLRSENFILADPHDGIMPIDYFVWVIRSPTARSSSTPASSTARQRSVAARCCAFPSTRAWRSSRLSRSSIPSPT